MQPLIGEHAGRSRPARRCQNRPAGQAVRPARGVVSLLSLTAALGAVLAHGQAQYPVLALRAAWVIDATGRPPIQDGVVVVRGPTHRGCAWRIAKC